MCQLHVLQTFVMTGLDKGFFLFGSKPVHKSLGTCYLNQDNVCEVCLGKIEINWNHRDVT